jgi:hypothetical protein
MPPDMKNPAAGDGRALRNLSDAGEAGQTESTTTDLSVNDLDDWRRRVQRDADAYLARRQPSRRPHRGGQR